MRIGLGREGFVQKRILDFVVVSIGTSNYHAHRANRVVAMEADVRKVHYLAIGLDCVHVLDFHVATFRLSPLFVFMHTSILCICTEIYKCIQPPIDNEQK